MDEGFEEIYPKRDDYKRFHQGNTSFVGARKRGYSDPEEKLRRIRYDLPGFSIVDYAFSSAALTAAQASHSGQGNQNSDFYSWSPLGVARKPEGVPIWEGPPEKVSRIVAKAGRYYGAVGIGFTELDKRWVYSHNSDERSIVFEDVEAGYVTEEKEVIPESHRWVIAITVPMEVEEMIYAPTALNPVSSMGYSRMPIVAGSLAEFIRGLGYNAIPCGNDTALSVPIAIQAGLGHIGRNGRLITWERGPWFASARSSRICLSPRAT